MLDSYLAASDIIDWQHPSILSKAAQLADGQTDNAVVARACFEFVRDKVRHSVDYRENPVTCKASAVLEYRTGYCYAKSHLLAALLRASGIPAGFCYQRLRLDGEHSSFCLHGLNAVWLEGHGWYRIDSRGNKPGVDAQFVPPEELLAFRLDEPGEEDLPGIFSEPLAVVTDALQCFDDWQALLQQLPDMTADAPIFDAPAQDWR